MSIAATGEEQDDPMLSVLKHKSLILGGAASFLLVCGSSGLAFGGSLTSALPSTGLITVSGNGTTVTTNAAVPNPSSGPVAGVLVSAGNAVLPESAEPTALADSLPASGSNAATGTASLTLGGSPAVNVGTTASGLPLLSANATT